MLYILNTTIHIFLYCYTGEQLNDQVCSIHVRFPIYNNNNRNCTCCSTVNKTCFFVKYVIYNNIKMTLILLWYIKNDLIFLRIKNIKTASNVAYSYSIFDGIYVSYISFGH